jgi:heat shock protein HslJ
MMGVNNKAKRTARRGIGLALVLVTSTAVCAGPPTLEDLKNLTYAGIYEEPVKLTEGSYQGEPFVSEGASRPLLQLAEQLFALDDLNRDGVSDAVVLLTESSGGSGAYTYLAVVVRQGEELTNIATQRLGDRVQVRSLEARDGLIGIEFVTTGSEEPACCPTLKVQESYRLDDGELVKVSAEALGNLSVSDIEGVPWKVTHLGSNQQVDDGIEITASFTADMISGSSGCNRYFAAVKSSGPYEIMIGPIGLTRMACDPAVMAAESRYLRALEQVKQFGFVYGTLSLTYEIDGGLDAMRLAPAR